MSELQTSNKEVEELHNSYNNIVKDGHLRGYSQIEDFSNKCLKFSKINKELTTPSFVLHYIFKRIATDRDERMVTVKENEEIYSVLNSPIQHLFKNMKTGEPYLETLNKLINDFEDFLNL